jgi:hypothetical protein
MECDKVTLSLTPAEISDISHAVMMCSDLKDDRANALILKLLAYAAPH